MILGDLGPSKFPDPLEPDGRHEYELRNDCYQAVIRVNGDAPDTLPTFEGDLGPMPITCQESKICVLHWCGSNTLTLTAGSEQEGFQFEIVRMDQHSWSGSTTSLGYYCVQQGGAPPCTSSITLTVEPSGYSQQPSQLKTRKSLTLYNLKETRECFDFPFVYHWGNYKERSTGASGSDSYLTSPNYLPPAEVEQRSQVLQVVTSLEGTSVAAYHMLAGTELNTVFAQVCTEENSNIILPVSFSGVSSLSSNLYGGLAIADDGSTVAFGFGESGVMKIIMRDTFGKTWPSVDLPEVGGTHQIQLPQGFRIDHSYLSSHGFYLAIVASNPNNSASGSGLFVYKRSLTGYDFNVAYESGSGNPTWTKVSIFTQSNGSLSIQMMQSDGVTRDTAEFGFVCADNNSEYKAGGCQCKDGFMIKNSANVLQKYLADDPTDVCIPAYQLDAVQTTASEVEIHINPLESELTVETIGNKNGIESGFVLLQKTNEGFEEVPNLKGISNLEMSSDGTKAVLFIQELQPGTVYEAIIDFHSDSIVFKFVTQCSCRTDVADRTGRPMNLSVFQVEGVVMFEFTDNSHCDTAYAFSRDESMEEFAKVAGTSVTTAPDFYHSQADTCDFSILNPGLQATDDLKISRLPVLHTFAYCVSAVNAVKYMDSPYDATEGSVALSSSENTCVPHTIRWQASIAGLITTLPSAGSLPIENVTISWHLFSRDLERLECDGCSGTVYTSEGGAFDIDISVAHPSLKGLDHHELPVQIFYQKTSNGGANSIEHVFLCNHGEDICDNEVGNFMYLRHLFFNEQLHIYDDTSLPFTGRVIVYDTPYPGSAGCPIQNAEVCLFRNRTVDVSEELVCVETDPNGEFSAPVVIGSIITDVQIHYNNHDFVMSYENNWEYKKGISISPDGFYANNDFIDISKSKLNIEGT